MESNPRGLCLIINNQNYYDEKGKEIEEKRRSGSDLDAFRLRNLFEKLSFRVDSYTDLREREMRDIVKKFASECECRGDNNDNDNDIDCCCVIILSHGSENNIICVDNKTLSIDRDILDLFDDVLVGKPKLFIIQSCRGETFNQKDKITMSPLVVNTCMSPSTPNTLTTTTTITTSQIKQETIHKSVQTIPVEFLEQTNDIIEDSIQKFKNLKVSSINSHAMFIKNDKSKLATTSVSPKPETIPIKQQQKSKFKQIKMRSRSHSRSKYVNYIQSAATAIKTVCSLTPNTCRTFIQQQQQQQQKSKIKQRLEFTSNEMPTLINNIGHSQSTETISISSDTKNKNEISFTKSDSIMSYELLHKLTDGRPIKTSTPSRSDFFIMYSTIRGHVSHRDIDGSPFLKCLVTVYSRCAYDLEILEMARKINVLMKQYEKRHYNQRNSVCTYLTYPSLDFYLTKKLYFNP
jgi:hypothetical protein